jgi:hypothetical protein
MAWQERRRPAHNGAPRPVAPDWDGNWTSNDGLTRNGHDRAGNALDGTPRQPNSARPEIPPTGTPVPAPTASALPSAATSTALPTVTLTAAPAPSNTATNAPTLTPTRTPTATPSPTPRRVLFLLVAFNAEPARAPLIISALHARGYAANADEAVQLFNAYAASLALDGLALSDAGGRAVRFPAGAPPVPAGGRVWAAYAASAFRAQFGFTPDFEYGADSDPLVPDLLGVALVLPNDGGSLALVRQARAEQDAANADGGAWPAGTAGPGYFSMERVDAGAPGGDANWASNDGVTRNGHDRNGGALNGTPRRANSAAVAPAPGSRVVISEIAWGGTAASSTDEWIELANIGDQPVSLAGWQLEAADGAPRVTLTGTLAAHGFFLLERGATTWCPTCRRPDLCGRADQQRRACTTTCSPNWLTRWCTAMARRGPVGTARRSSPTRRAARFPATGRSCTASCPCVTRIRAPTGRRTPTTCWPGGACAIRAGTWRRSTRPCRSARRRC